MNIDFLPSSNCHDEEVFMDRERPLAETRAGFVIEKPLLKTTPKNTRTPDILTQILSASTPFTREKDRILFRKLIRNANNQFPAIGKPSSAFAFIEQGRVYLHFLREFRDFDRDVQLHDYLRDLDAKNGNRYQRAQSLLSGHLAIITPEYQESGPYSYLMLLDKIADPKEHITRSDQFVINALHANGVIPVTSNDYPQIIESQ